ASISEQRTTRKITTSGGTCVCAGASAVRKKRRFSSLKRGSVWEIVSGFRHTSSSIAHRIRSNSCSYSRSSFSQIWRQNVAKRGSSVHFHMRISPSDSTVRTKVLPAVSDAELDGNFCFQTCERRGVERLRINERRRIRNRFA